MTKSIYVDEVQEITLEPKKMHIPSQNMRILRYLDDHNCITAADAMKELGIYRLAARISDLEDLGYKFERSKVIHTNRYGEKTRFTAYSLESEGE